MKPSSAGVITLNSLSFSVTAWNLVLAGSLRLKVTQRSVQVQDVHVRVSVDTLKVSTAEKSPPSGVT